MTPHSLRYTFAALALQKGISSAAVKEILGANRLSRLSVTEERTASCDDEILYSSNEELLKHAIIIDLGRID